MTMSVIWHIDLGNVWEALAAFGTVAASSIALYLACDERRKKISASFIWEVASSYHATLLLTNTSKQNIIVENIDFSYRGKFYRGINLLDKLDEGHESYILLPGKSNKIHIVMPEELHSVLKNEEIQFAAGIQLDEKYIKKAKKRRKFKIFITDNCGKKYKLKRYYSDEKLLQLFFGEVLFENER